MYLRVAFIFIFIAFNLNAQVKLVNKKIDGHLLIYELETENNYTLQKTDNINKIIFQDFMNEAKPGEPNIPSHDFFIAIPPKTNPQVSYEIIKENKIKAIPELNPIVSLEDNKIKYSRKVIPKFTSKQFLEVLGSLWLGNNYCLHIKINPFLISKNNGIDYIEKVRLIITFQSDIKINKLDENTIVSDAIFNKEFAKQIQANPVFDLSNSDYWIDYTKTYLKIGTPEDGIYRLTKNNIDSMGINTSEINPKSIKLILSGSEVPIWVEGENDYSFDANDYIEFIGFRNMGGKHRNVSNFDEPYNEYLGRYTDTTVYWLTWDGIDGKRVNLFDGKINPLIDTLEYYSQINHYEKNNWFDFSCASLVRRETPFWIENKTWHEGNLRVGRRNANFTVNNVFPDKACSVYVKFQDYASNISTNSHLVTLGVNSSGDWSDSTYIDKYEQVVLKLEFNSDLLESSNNKLIINSLPTQATINACIFDWYEIEYPRFLIPIDKTLNFIFPSVENNVLKNIKIKNLSSENFSLWKYGNSYKKYNVTKMNNEIVFADTISSVDKFIYVEESKIQSPKIYYVKQFVNLRSNLNNADYIAITHKRFKNKVDEYSQFISENYNIKSKVVDIDDIYDEYSYGFFNPEVIKDFLISTHENWQEPKPSNVLLIGGATYDYYGNKYKNFASITERVINYVPSFGASASDNWFVTWDTTGAYIPQMNIGRIPVTTNGEFDWYFEKHRNYISQKYDVWNKQYLFFSGGNEKKQSELNQLRESNQYVIDNFVIPNPIGGKAKHFYKTIDPQTSFGPYSTEYVENVINDGAVFISYLGHSGTQTWDNTIINPEQLKNNRNRYPIVSDFGCSTGRFAEPDVVSFSQSFTIGHDGQALIYIGNASLGFVSTSLAMPKLFYKKILRESVFNVSEAHKEAKLEMLQTYGSTGIYKLFALTNTLIGDPILTLPIPTKPNFVVKVEGIQLDSELLTDLHDSVEVTIKVSNYGRVELDSLIVLAIHQFQTEADSLFSVLDIPSFSDSISIKLNLKNKAGNHNVLVIVDPNNQYEEISKEDNIAQITFNVASSSIRPLIQYQFENGIENNLDLLNPTAMSNDEIIVVDISKSFSFTNFTSNEIPFDPLLSKFGFEGLESGIRYWCRTKVKGEGSYSTYFSFIPEGQKYYLFDSLSMNKFSLIHLTTNGNKTSIDTTKVTFELMSAGFTDGNTALILKNNKNYLFGGISRGHYITTFKDSTYEFIESILFDLIDGGSTEANKYSTFLDTVSADNLVMFSIRDDGSSNLTNELRNKIKTFGSSLIDDVKFRSSWAFIGKKGADPGTMPEAYSNQGNGPVTIDTTISFLAEKGSMLTTEIGPTGMWDKLVVNQKTPSNSSITYTPIGIKSDGIMDTLTILSFQDSVTDLRHINSDIYPKMKILADFTASDDKLSPVLKSLGVDYNDVAELAMNYQVVSVEKDSISQGDKNKLSFFIYNVGETKADSVSVKIELQKSDNTSILLDKFTTSIDSSNKKKFEYDFTILNSYGFGEMAYSITVDEDEKITEFFKDNNFFQIPFYVEKDTITSVNSIEIQVKFDGFDILNGDFVSNKPNILFELNYSGNFPTDDTSAVIFTLDNKRIYYSTMNVDYETINKSIKYSCDPEIMDGEHFLKAYGNSILQGNDFGIEKYFVVSNKLKAVDIFNFPNPASSETYFTFRLPKVPEELNIKIFTVTGRLIKTFDLKSYDLKTDLNKIRWNLTDEDGDNIANGIYLYKVILKAENKVEHYTQKLAIVR